MGRAHEVRAASMAKTAAIKSKLYARYGKEIFIAAKAGVPDPDMNLALARKIKEAKQNQVPADVIKRAVDRAKGGDASNYTECRYEGFGPAGTTVIVDCLTDNTNRAMVEVKNAFMKTKGAKMAGAGAVSFGYKRLGVCEFETEKSEDELMEILFETGADITDMQVEDNYAEIKVNPSDLPTVREALEAAIPGVEFDRCEVTMIADEMVNLTDENDITFYNKLISMLEDCDDVDKVYTNAVLPD